ncbi:MAG: hypothetical protein AB1442_02905 [Nitrospirota bacterium]
MRIRNLLSVVAMLSVLLFGFGTAHAVLGVADQVPGQDVVFPIICGQTGNNLNTLWAIADTVATPDVPFSDNQSCARIFVFDKRSQLVFDDDICWTANDVVVDDCKALIARMSTSQQAALEVDLDPGAVTHYAGYITYQQAPDLLPGAALVDRYVPWVYLVDLQKGFAAGMNGVAAELGLGIPGLNEVSGSLPVTAATIFPRYFILNTLADSWNWWILLMGANEDATTPFVYDRRLQCVICNEEEVCISTFIDIPDELMILNVVDHLPAVLHETPPFAGFANCSIVSTSGTFTQVGTIDANDPATTTDDVPYSLYGWSYQRAADSSATLSWSVIHTIDRLYCSEFGGPHSPFTAVQCIPTGG